MQSEWLNLVYTEPNALRMAKTQLNLCTQNGQISTETNALRMAKSPVFTESNAPRMAKIPLK